MDGPATDDQWRALLAALARHLLEVERGLRPATQLESLLPAATVQMWRRQHRPGQLDGGPVTPADIGPVRFSRTGRSVFASIPTAISQDRWASLSVQLRRMPDGRWRVADLYRVTPGRHYARARPTRDADPAVRSRLLRR